MMPSNVDIEGKTVVDIFFYPVFLSAGPSPFQGLMWTYVQGGLQ